MSEPKQELRECPFCGSNKVTIEWEPCAPITHPDTNRRWFAECTQCSCQGPFCQRETEVIKAWNTRTTDKRVEELEVALDKLDNTVSVMRTRFDELEKENAKLREVLESAHPARVWDVARQYYTDGQEAILEANWKNELCKQVDQALAQQKEGTNE